MGGERLRDELLELLAEDLSVEFPRVGSERVGVPGCCFGASNRVHQRFDLLFIEQDSSTPIDHRIQGSTAGVGDHWPAASVGLQGSDTEVLFAGKDQRPGELPPPL